MKDLTEESNSETDMNIKRVEDSTQFSDARNEQKQHPVDHNCARRQTPCGQRSPGICSHKYISVLLLSVTNWFNTIVIHRQPLLL